MSKLFNRYYQETEFNLLTAYCAQLRKARPSEEQRIHQLLTEHLTAHADEALVEAEITNFHRIARESLTAWCEKSDQQINKDIGILADTLYVELRRYPVLKSRTEDALEPEIRALIQSRETEGFFSKLTSSKDRHLRRDKKLDRKKVIKTLSSTCEQLFVTCEPELKASIRDSLHKQLGFSSKAPLSSAKTEAVVLPSVLLVLYMCLVLTAGVFIDIENAEALSHIENPGYWDYVWFNVPSAGGLSQLVTMCLIVVALVNLTSGNNRERLKELTPSHFLTVTGALGQLNTNGYECGDCDSPALELVSSRNESYRWKHAKKDGSKDLRYSENSQTMLRTEERVCKVCGFAGTYEALYDDGKKLQLLSLRHGV